jgi:GntR family transcriptional regulator, transcriptional repressor for pyruvate dehydrogenase complex
MKLQKIHQKRAFQLVAEQLEEAILSGVFKPGDKLPPERNTIRDLGTSRRSLREAMRVLEQKGLIEIRLGVKGGSFVKRPSTESLSKDLDVLIRFKQVPVQELAEFRLDLEGSIARRAARRADDHDIACLKKIASEAEAALADPDTDFRNYQEIDREYHLALAAAARNQLYASVLRIVHDNMSRYFKKHLDWHRGRFHDHHKEMIEMIEALKNRDADRAFTLANDHIQEFFRHVDAENQ